MAATEHLPSPNAEDIMAYLDGEGTEAWRASIEAHLATCEPCQTLAAEQQHLSASLGAWHVDAAPASLRVPAAAQRPRPQGLPQRLAGRRWRRVGLVGLSAAATVVLGLSLSQGSRFTEAGRSPGDADLTSGAPMPSSTSAGNLPEPVSSFVGGEASTLDRAYRGQRPGIRRPGSSHRCRRRLRPRPHVRNRCGNLRSSAPRPCGSSRETSPASVPRSRPSSLRPADSSTR